MNKLAIFLVVIGVTYGLYSNNAQKNKQAAKLEAEVVELRKEKARLAAHQAPEAQTLGHAAPGKTNENPSAKQARVKDLQNQFNAETTKLIALQRRKDQLASAVNDPGQASSITEAKEEIREKNEQIQSLQLQLNNSQYDEKLVDHNAETAKQYQNLNKAQATADLNNRIHFQQELIRNTQDTIKAYRIQATADSNNRANALTAQLAQQKADLESMRLSREQVNVTSAAQGVQIHEQVGAAKNNLYVGEQEIRGQIAGLKNDIKNLQNQTAGATRTTAQLKDQMSHVDQQISSEKIVIDRLQKLLAAETAK